MKTAKEVADLVLAQPLRKCTMKHDESEWKFCTFAGEGGICLLGFCKDYIQKYA